MTQQDSNADPNPIGSVSKRDYLRLLLATMGVGALSTGSVETAKAAHLSDSPYPSGAWGYAPIASHGVSDRPSIAELNEAWSKTYHFLNQDVDVGARYYAEKNDSEWDLLPIVWDSLDAPAKEDMPAGSMKIEDNNSDSFRLVSIDDDGSDFREATIAWAELPLNNTIIWETATDWDNSQSENGVHHEQPTGTDWAASNIIEKGYPTFDQTGSSLLHYWPLDEDTGTTANDVTGQNNGAIDGPTVNQTPGPFGNSYYLFDGNDDNINLDGPAITSSQNRTFCAWGYSTSFGNPSWFSMGPNNDFERWTFRYTTNNKLRIEVQGGGYTSSLGSGDEWVFVGCVLNGTTLGDHTIYHWDEAGGLQSDDATGTDTIDTQPGDSNTWIGRTTYGAYFNERMSDVRLYDRALTQTQLQSMVDAAVNTSDYWSSKKTAIGANGDITMTTTTTIPTNTSITMTLFEDVNDDGSGGNTDAIGNSYENNDTVTLSGGSGEENTLTGFDTMDNSNGYWWHAELTGDGINPTLNSPTISRVELTPA